MNMRQFEEKVLQRIVLTTAPSIYVTSMDRFIKFVDDYYSFKNFRMVVKLCQSLILGRR